MDNFQIEDFNVNITLDALSPLMLWESRFEEFKKVQNSHRIYEEMGHEHRDAIVERVRRATAVMYDTVDSWLPDAISLSDDGSCVKIEFNLVLAKVDIDVEAKNKATSFQLMEVKKEIQSLLEDEA